MLGKGEIATMSLGSWAIVQMQEKPTDPADIGYLPFPVHVGGKFHAVSQLSARCGPVGDEFRGAVESVLHGEERYVL